MSSFRTSIRLSETRLRKWLSTGRFSNQNWANEQSDSPLPGILSANGTSNAETRSLNSKSRPSPCS